MRLKYSKPKKALAVLLSLSFLLTGCSLRRDGKKVEEEEKNQVEYVSSIDELENGHYYIHHEGQYLKPYIGNASFDTVEDRSQTSGNDRVAWFMDDWSKIPTLYSGDYIVFYTESPLSEEFNIERFEYMGYTLGICGLKRTKSGRYSFDATGSSSKYVNKESDAARLLDLGEESVIIDNIGSAKLRSGNITRAGTVQGLKEDCSYTTDVYVGSKVKTYVLKADSIALCSMEHYSTSDYTFLRSSVIRINLPSYLNDGYYAVNGSGIFRYVRGRSYSANTDFNVPNEVTSMEKEEDKEQKINEASDTTVKESFILNREGETKIVITYGENMDTDYNMADPEAKLIGTAAVYTFTNDDVGEMSMTADLKPGNYTIEITGLFGRSYEYNVSQPEEK